MLASVLACISLEHGELNQHPPFWLVARNKDIKGNSKLGNKSKQDVFSTLLLFLSVTFLNTTAPPRAPFGKRPPLSGLVGSCHLYICTCVELFL